MIRMRIRRAAHSVLPSIAALHAESWQDTYSNDLPAEFLAGPIHKVFAQHWNDVEIRNDDIILVAEENFLLGFITIWCDPVPFIDNLHVRLSHRSHKIGFALMKAASKELVKKGHQSAYLWVFDSNRNAIRFYERLGGVPREQAMKNVFGYDVLSRKIEWDDLSQIFNPQTAP